MQLDWIPESYPRSGGLAAAGFYKLLGRPRLDPLTVLVRETAQNSWDARQPDTPVAFALEGWELETSELAALRSSVFVGASGAGIPGLDEFLSRPDPVGLYISDRGTRGLGGPFHADQVDPDGIYDWVDFVLNVGKANTQGLTGGTYGFGKTISYIVSAVNTVVIYSHTVHRGRRQSRLIACAIGGEFERGGRLFTGRHWWGRDSEGIPLPLTGAAADDVAAEIGMPGFEDEELGTSILLLDPDFETRSPPQAMRYLAEAVTWNLWPKLLEHDGLRAMDVSVWWNGTGIPVPEPADRPPLHGFEQAYRALRESEGGSLNAGQQALGMRLDVIRCQRPKTDAGDLVTLPLVQRPRAVIEEGDDPSGSDDDELSPAALIVGPSHHVALLRAPDLVVQYMAGPPPADGLTEWAGVFRCRDEHDGKFARSEPPTHDSWEPRLMEDRTEKTIVNVALKKIREVLEDRWIPSSDEQPAAPLSTSAVANDLAALVRTVDGRGPGREAGGGGGSGGGGSRNARVEILRTGPMRRDGEFVTKADCRLVPRAGSRGTIVHVQVGVALDGATLDGGLDPLLHLSEIRFADHSRPLSGTNEAVDIGGSSPTDFTILVERGPDTTVLFDLRTEVVEHR